MAANREEARRRRDQAGHRSDDPHQRDETLPSPALFPSNPICKLRDADSGQVPWSTWLPNPGVGRSRGRDQESCPLRSQVFGRRAKPASFDLVFGVLRLTDELRQTGFTMLLSLAREPRKFRDHLALIMLEPQVVASIAPPAAPGVALTSPPG